MDQQTAERIADALERIAAALEERPKDRRQHNRLPASRQGEFLAMLNANSDKLKGRMTMADVESVLGVAIEHGDRLSMGLAMTEYGARKGRTGSTRYYVFA